MFKWLVDIAAEAIACETRAAGGWGLDRDCLQRRMTDPESAFVVGTESNMKMKRRGIAREREQLVTYALESCLTFGCT